MNLTEKEIEQKAKIFSLNRERQLAYIFGYKDAIKDLYTDSDVRSLIYSAYAAASEFDLDPQEFWELNKKKS